MNRSIFLTLSPHVDYLAKKLTRLKSINRHFLYFSFLLKTVRTCVDFLNHVSDRNVHYFHSQNYEQMLEMIIF